LETNIAVFRGKEIRKTIHKNEWWFSVVDVIEALTGRSQSHFSLKFSSGPLLHIRQPLPPFPLPA